MSPLIKWEPLFEPFEEMNKFFEGQLMPARRGFIPLVDVYETKDSVIVEIPLPGIEPSKVNISIENDVLTVKGEVEKKSEVEDKNYYRKEVRTGSFYRSVALPTHVLADKASAVSQDGILKIAVPKAPEKKAKTIKVKVTKSKASK